MKKLILFVLISLMAHEANCQTWPAPGATWYYRLKTGIGQGQGNYDGHITVMPTGTVLINGKVCTTIAGGWSGTWNWPISMPMNWGNSIDTYFDNNVLYYYETKSGNFDTLMNYNAQIGDGWYVSGWDSSCFTPRIKMTVTDTGHIQIGNASLKTFTAGGYQLIERIGNANLFFHPMYICYMDQVDTRGAFRCYRDNQIGIYSITGECNFVGIDGSEKSRMAPAIFPNPSQGVYSMTVSSAGWMKVFASDGSLVVSEKKEAGDQTLDLTCFPDGIYFIHIDQNTPVKVCKISK